MLIRIHLALLLSLAFSSIVAPAHAQGKKHHSITTPVNNTTADPIQGGALSEYHDASGNASANRPADAYPPSRPRLGDPSRRIVDRPPAPKLPQTGPDNDLIDTSNIPPPAPIQELIVQSELGVRWLCGGIGQREVAYMKKMASAFDVMLTFATADGAYLADVDIHIIDERRQTVLQTHCGAPILLVDLPKNGNYRVDAVTKNHTVSRTLRIPRAQGANLNLVMTWPSR